MKNMRPDSVFALCLICISFAFPPGCTQDEAPSKQTPIAVDRSPSSPDPKFKVSKIVFIGKHEACACTRKRIDQSWAALEKALDKTKDIRIERLHADTEQTKVAAYQQQRAIMVIPAVFFLDSSGALVEVLQGEISTEQFSSVLR